jgi:putative aldouronate transport system permease protein
MEFMQKTYSVQKSEMVCPRKSFGIRFRRQYQLYLMLLPAVVLAAVFSYGPLSGWVMAFTDYQLGKNMFTAKWTGFTQFQSFFGGANDALFTVRNTLVINLLSLFVGLFAACAFSVLLNEVHSKGVKKIVQTSSFFPYFVSWVIVYMIFNSFFAVKSGVINELLVSMGIIKHGINFLGDANYSWVIILLVNTWKVLGYNSVIFLSALAGIDQEQYEAAYIDGASRFQKIHHITVPSLAPTLVVLLIMNSGWIFASNFEQMYLFTNGSNWQTMEVLDLYVYDYGLKYLNFSYATAVGIIETMASIIMFMIVNYTAKKINGRSIM